jgi:para-nitrobenzyl esterase
LQKQIIFVFIAVVILVFLIAGCIVPQQSNGQTPLATTVIPAHTGAAVTETSQTTVPSNNSLVVKTDAGYVSGLQQNGLRVYLGIPFAAPPVGNLRWRPPAPVQPWSGVKQATAFGANPLQPPQTQPGQSEDCLYLNVWTPAKSADEKLPVMVFFYGGAFGQIEGGGNISQFNGTTLAKKGVIIVTTNYRLGPLGFLAHPELDSESSHNSSGNYGIMDQVAALQWVRQNIGAFGGDPSRVTIFGQSAGGESVLIHLVSPGSEGLYQQALVESGPFWAHGPTIDNVHSKADAEQIGIDYAQSLGYPGPDAIEQMRNVSADLLVNATPWPASSWENTHTLKFEPTIDGWVLTDSVDALFQEHRENPVPFFIGTNANDGSVLTKNANMTVPEYVAFIRNYFGKNADAVLAQYPANSTQEVQLRLSQIMTRYDFADSARFAAGSMAYLDPDTYLYRYSYNIPSLNMGAFHGSETFLLFGAGPELDADPAVIDNVVDLWTNFAKTGDPNGGMNITWPRYTRAGDRYLDINTTPLVETGY